MIKIAMIGANRSSASSSIVARGIPLVSIVSLNGFETHLLN